MRGYGQDCPMARAAEILANRWTLIIVRDPLLGCATVGAIADGAPGTGTTALPGRGRGTGYDRGRVRSDLTGDVQELRADVNEAVAADTPLAVVQALEESAGVAA